MENQKKWEPFILVKDESGVVTGIQLHGTASKKERVELGDVWKIMDAIHRGWNIDVHYAAIGGGMDVFIKDEVAGELNEDDKITVAGVVRMSHSIIKGKVNFSNTKFEQGGNFAGTTFEPLADFSGATFKEKADFWKVTFGEKADFSGATFEKEADFGDTTFGEQATFCGATFESIMGVLAAYFWNATFKKVADFRKATFGKEVYFNEATFEKKADFNGTTFGEGSYFRGASFEKEADFRGASFEKGANFVKATFVEEADFGGVMMKYPASFAGVQIRENTVWRGLWIYILRPFFWWLWPVVWFFTIGKVDLRETSITDIYKINTNTVMDASTNPRLKRYIDDEQWIESWRRNPKGRWWREPVFWLWELTSHCGRSIGLWMFWSFMMALVFGFLYKGHIYIDPNTVKNWYTPFYFSVVTFTTLGFGDVKPADSLGQLWITLEVLSGYIMLGGLISIFANKFARRS